MAGKEFSVGEMPPEDPAVQDEWIRKAKEREKKKREQKRKDWEKERRKGIQP